jgi:DNA-binding CsgD family transcriptional regulator
MVSLDPHLGGTALAAPRATIVRVFLLYRDPDGRRHMFALPDALSRATIGRRRSCDVALPWDDQVSRLHAELLRMGDDWVICDDGLSHNGTFVNGERVRSRRRLVAGDAVQVGGCTLSVGEAEPAGRTPPTRPAGAEREIRHVTPAQRRLLEVLCRGSVPPSNREIADELGISVDTVKATLTVLFERFELEALPQNAKRAALVRAFSGSRSA